MSVKSTIDFYLAEESPGYALQITGEWGAGKTHAVKKILQNDMYYLSLFDIQSSDEVYSSIFYLMQKNKEKAKRALSNLKKIDISFWGIKLPVGDVFSSLSNAIIRTEVINDKPIVFDDIERSSLSQDVIFGIISNYIETHNCHVIILMNDNKEKENSQYKCLSEKTIGRVVRVTPEYNESYDSFILNTRNKDILSSIKSKLISIFMKSNCNSLRILKRIIFEIDIICSCIDFGKHKDITNEIYEGLFVFTITSIAAKQGKINKSNIEGRKLISYYKNSTINGKNIDNEIKACKEIYDVHIDDVDISITILNDVVLNDIIFDGKYNRHLIIESINNYQKINKNNIEVPWKTIYKFMQHSDSDIKNALDEIKSIIENRTYYPLPHILQFISAIIYISDYVAYDFGKNGMECYFINYIDDLYKKELLDTIDFSNTANIYNFDSVDNYGYYSSEKEQFKIIKKYLITKAGDLRDKKINEESQNLLLLMKDDIDIFSKKLTDKSYEFMLEPLLSNINYVDFIDSFISLDFPQLDKVNRIITTRFYRNQGYSKLKSEYDWLMEIIKLLKIKVLTFSGIKKFRIQCAIDRFETVFNQ
ncbi:hypothetical protein [Morganella morganii]|uniref:hypothetical protein n=1 Tax=Morganella morganii TaxID=582 RepID=UPI003EB9CD26